MRRFATSLALAFFLPAAFAQSTPPTAATPKLGPAECEVWARELSFARSVAEHDAAAFAEHLHPHAAFGASRVEPTRGRAAIAERWAGIVEGEAVGLEWYPTRTTIAASEAGDVAWSSGPSLFIDKAPDAKARYSIGAFHSVWRKGADGVWRVLFDDGVPGAPASEDQVAAFRAARSARCPTG